VKTVHALDRAATVIVGETRNAYGNWLGKRLRNVHFHDREGDDTITLLTYLCTELRPS
jgi:hypothetical protein